MMTLLFSPEGRINKSEFQRGALILLLLNFFLWQTWHLGLGLGVLALFIAVVSIYCWCCLFTKRFHQAGVTGFLFILVLIGFFVLTQIFIAVVAGILGVTEDIASYQAILQEIDPYNADPEEVMAIYSSMTKTMAMPAAISYLLAGLVAALGLNVLLKEDPDANRYGPPA